MVLFWDPGYTKSARSYRIKSKAKTIPNSSATQVSAEAKYPYDPDFVWEVVNDFAEFSKYAPRVSVCEPLETIRGQGRLFVLLDLPWPFPDLWNVVSIAQDEKAYRLDWKLIEGNMKTNAGYITIKKRGKGSLVRLNAEVDPGLLLPKWIVGWSTKRFIPKVLIALGRQLDRLSQPGAGKENLTKSVSGR